VRRRLEEERDVERGEIGRGLRKLKARKWRWG